MSDLAQSSVTRRFQVVVLVVHGLGAAALVLVFTYFQENPSIRAYTGPYGPKNAVLHALLVSWPLIVPAHLAQKEIDESWVRLVLVCLAVIAAVTIACMFIARVPPQSMSLLDWFLAGMEWSGALLLAISAVLWRSERMG